MTPEILYRLDELWKDAVRRCDNVSDVEQVVLLRKRLVKMELAKKY